jgi:hypothetical protein
VGTPLTFQQLQDQFANQNRPVVTSWNWCGTGGHVPVAFGYTTAGGEQVWMLDPGYDDPQLISYSVWSHNPNGNGTCAPGDPVGHAFHSNEYDIQP